MPDRAAVVVTAVRLPPPLFSPGSVPHVVELDVPATVSTISGFSVGVGSGATAGYHAFADNVTFATTAGSNTYNFDQAALVPEPATWAMMIFGFGAIGISLRSGKRRSAQKSDRNLKGLADSALA